MHIFVTFDQVNNGCALGDNGSSSQTFYIWEVKLAKASFSANAKRNLVFLANKSLKCDTNTLLPPRPHHLLTWSEKSTEAYLKWQPCNSLSTLQGQQWWPSSMPRAPNTEMGYGWYFLAASWTHTPNFWSLITSQKHNCLVPFRRMGSFLIHTRFSSDFYHLLTSVLLSSHFKRHE